MIGKHLQIASSMQGWNSRPFGAPDDTLANCATRAKAGTPFYTEHPLTCSKATAFSALVLKVKGH